MGNWKLTKSQEPQALTEPVLREMRTGKTGGLTRRQLIRRSLGAAVALWLLEVGAGTLGFLWPNLARGFGGQINLGDFQTVSDSPEISGLTLSDGAPSYFPTARTFVILNDPNLGFQNGESSDGEGTATNVTTMFQKCPHLGCKPNFCESNFWFECPCHGSRYDRLGVKVQELGPAPRGMDRFAHRIDDGSLIVDTSKVVLGPLPVALGQPGLIPAHVAHGLHLMTEDKSGRELTPREPGEVEASDSALTPVEGEQRDVERFSSGPRAHSVGLTEERAAKVVRQSANARNVAFLAVLLVALFIPVYWFYESGVPALGTEARMDASAEAQYVTDVARGYELYLANCAECHGEQGQGGIGPRLNDQAKLYNVVTPAGNPGNGHLNPIYLENVLTVGGRYVCGDPNSLMAAWQEPDGPLNYRQVEELILWMNASQDVVFEVHEEHHGEGEEEASESAAVRGWRDPNWEPGPDETPVPACWKAPNGLAPAPAGGGDTAAAATPAPDGGGTEPVAGGTPDEPRVIQIEANAALQFLDENGVPLTQINAVPGETIEFVVDNSAGFEHNFYIGQADALQVPYGETEVGIPTWTSGVESYTWTVPEAGAEGLQFACTVPGHYTPMHGDIVITAGAAAGEGDADTAAEGEAAETTDEAAEPADDEAVAETAAGGTPEEPRVIKLTANAALQFLDENGVQLTSIDAVPGETIEFQIDNTAGFEHNFFIGPADALQVPYGETEVGIPTWTSGVESYIWTVPESGAEGLQFACTVPGHYTPMHGDIVISS